VDRQSSSAIQNEEGVRRKGKHWRDHPLVRRLASWLESRPVATVMSLLTFYALFGDDIRLAGASRAQDEAFFDLSFVCLVMFATEILLNSIVRRDYFLRFYFWLDLIATISLFSDVGWLWNPIMGSSNELQVHSNQVSHVARTGSRAGRVVRVVRMVRLFRIGKLYRYLMEHPALPQRLRRPSRTSTMVSDFPDTDMNARFKERSQVGRVLSDRTTRRVILLILLLLIGFPLFDTATYREPPSRRDLALHAVHALSFDPSSRLFNETLNAFVAADDSLLHLRLPGMDEDAVITLLRSMPSFRGGTYLAHFTAVQRIYRATEVVLAEATGCYLTSGALGTLSAEQCQTVAVWSVRDFERLSAALNIGQTLFIIVMLGIGAMLFMADATQLVIQPLANLVSMVYTLARNPLEALVDSTGACRRPPRHPCACRVVWALLRDWHVVACGHERSTHTYRHSRSRPPLPHDARDVFATCSQGRVQEGPRDVPAEERAGAHCRSAAGGPGGGRRADHRAAHPQVHVGERDAQRRAHVRRVRVLRHPAVHRRDRVPAGGGHGVREPHRQHRAHGGAPVRRRAQQERRRRVPARVAHDGRGPPRGARDGRRGVRGGERERSGQPARGQRAVRLPAHHG
jgi:hypothetical protein